uniref:Uncharacterized protein n=1 Tax=uncultured marine virus TaxID=186617 RepID=A0A0F7KZW7_9VIRU|nr:hypothetical protein [uncultured marine virus]
MWPVNTTSWELRRHRKCASAPLWSLHARATGSANARLLGDWRSASDRSARTCWSLPQRSWTKLHSLS